MKTLTLSFISMAAVCVAAGAQEPAPPAGSTAQADKQFLQQLERNRPVGQNQSADPAAAPVNGQPSAASADDKRPKHGSVAKKTAERSRSKKAEPAGPGNAEAIETPPVRTVNQERAAKTTASDPFYNNAGRAPVGAGAKFVKTTSLPEVAAGPSRTVTVTKTTATVPPPAPKDDDGFFSRLFRHKDRSGE